MKYLKGRLTKREETGKIVVCGMDETNEVEKAEACVFKLCEYEDLGFHPSDIEMFLKNYDDMVVKLDAAQASIDRSRGIIRLLENELQGLRNKVPEWVSVSEGLPCENVRVLVACKTKKGFRSHNLAFYADGHWYGTGSMSAVTHWAELPCLPIE